MKRTTEKVPKTMRVEREVAELFDARAREVGVSVSEYLRVLAQAFAGIDTQQYLELKARRDALRERLRTLLNEVSALDTAIDSAEADRDAMVLQLERIEDDPEIDRKLVEAFERVLDESTAAKGQ